MFIAEDNHSLLPIIWLPKSLSTTFFHVIFGLSASVHL